MIDNESITKHYEKHVEHCLITIHMRTLMSYKFRNLIIKELWLGGLMA